MNTIKQTKIQKQHELYQKSLDVITCFKKAKGYGMDDLKWNKYYFKLFKPMAEKLLDIADGNFKLVKDCMYWVKGKADRDNWDWTLNTVFKQFPDFLMIRQREEGKRKEHQMWKQKLSEVEKRSEKEILERIANQQKMSALIKGVASGKEIKK